MKKFMSIVLTVTMAGVLLAGCGEKQEKLNSLQAVQKAGILTIGTDDSYPPMEFRDSKNTLVGFDVDLATEIGKKLGVKIEHTTTDFNGILLALNSSRFNIIVAALSITDKRKESIDFSDSYLMGGQVVTIKKGNTSIKSLEDLKGKIVACQLGSTGDTAASALKGLKEIKKYDKITEAFQELSSKRVDAVVMDAQVGGYYVSKKPGEFEVLKDRISEEPMGIGFKKEDKELKAAIQKALNELKSDGTLSKLSQKWFGFDAYKK
ncbi:ABC transporter substrate-binding protein [Clostridium estertheticum]|uniref:ABC transporter substrate-binding protein n=1 Tax=Clostridium estertheticum TaxID=238834 RepID=UPI0013E8F6CC|nr:ABC transporter substrate-binding protein [Clostridium estertheticum]MBZ9687275.1 ABC transporter substrate-binding protein [Clostridium estertheticum]